MISFMELSAPKTSSKIDLGVVADMPIEMHIDAAVLVKQFVEHDSRLVEPLQVRVEPRPQVSR